MWSCGASWRSDHRQVRLHGSHASRFELRPSEGRLNDMLMLNVLPLPRAPLGAGGVHENGSSSAARAKVQTGFANPRLAQLALAAREPPPLPQHRQRSLAAIARRSNFAW